MSEPYLRKGSKLFQIKVPTRHAGGWIKPVERGRQTVA